MDSPGNATDVLKEQHTTWLSFKDITVYSGGSVIVTLGIFTFLLQLLTMGLVLYKCWRYDKRKTEEYLHSQNSLSTEKLTLSVKGNSKYLSREIYQCHVPDEENQQWNVLSRSPLIYLNSFQQQYDMYYTEINH